MITATFDAKTIFTDSSLNEPVVNIVGHELKVSWPLKVEKVDPALIFGLKRVVIKKRCEDPIPSKKSHCGFFKPMGGVCFRSRRTGHVNYLAHFSEKFMELDSELDLKVYWLKRAEGFLECVEVGGDPEPNLERLCTKYSKYITFTYELGKLFESSFLSECITVTFEAEEGDYDLEQLLSRLQKRSVYNFDSSIEIKYKPMFNGENTVFIPNRRFVPPKGSNCFIDIICERDIGSGIRPNTIIGEMGNEIVLRKPADTFFTVIRGDKQLRFYLEENDDVTSFIKYILVRYTIF
ncbi:MAG: hypothetical protein KatS3mg101_0878 [Patescibacteria group bacterium]|nr:MAG: hypothetical protein KatS3mg101_0878 [Patescibacteria group bacterium]